MKTDPFETLLDKRFAEYRPVQLPFDFQSRVMGRVRNGTKLSQSGAGVPPAFFRQKGSRDGHPTSKTGLILAPFARVRAHSRRSRSLAVAGAGALLASLAMIFTLAAWRLISLSVAFSILKLIKGLAVHIWHFFDVALSFLGVYVRDFVVPNQAFGRNFSIPVGNP